VWKIFGLEILGGWPMAVEWVASDPNAGPVATLPALSLDTIVQRDTEHLVAVLAVFVFLGVVAAVAAFVWHRPKPGKAG
jgi:hypothetical protein